MVDQVVADLLAAGHAVGNEPVPLLPAAHRERVFEFVGIHLGDVFGYAEALDIVDVAQLEVEHRVAAVAARGARLDLHLAGVVRRDRGYHNPSPVDVRHVGFGVEPLARAGVLFQRPDQGVRHVAFERIGRVEQFEDYEIQRESPVDTVDVDRVDPVFGGDDLFADALDAVVDEELRVGQTADVLTHQVGELGADLLDAGYESQADLVAQVFGRAVRRIFPVGNVLCYGVFEDVLARSEHQRADQLPGMGGDARQTPQAGAAQQVDEEGFDRVVDVVGDGYHRVTVLAAQFVEPGVAQPPCGHFHRFARALHLAFGVEAFVVPGHAVLLRLAAYEFLVLFALHAPQLEIAVGHADAIAASHEEREHDHRVHAARNGQQDEILRSCQLVAADVALEIVQ